MVIETAHVVNFSPELIGIGKYSGETAEWLAALDDFLTKEEVVRPAMLKLDVQGFEIQALAGCKRLISNFDVYCECSFVELYTGQALAGEVVGYLDELGFKLSGIYNLSYDCDGNCIQADLLFAGMEP